MAEELKPIKLKFDDGEEYVLEFSAQTAKDAQQGGFKASEVFDKSLVMIPLLFYFSFKMHHPQISRKKTDSILNEDLGGLSEAMQDRLVELYLAPINALANAGMPKNPRLTVEL